MMKHYLKLTHLFIVVCTVLMLTLASSCQAASLTIAANGKSTFSIVVPKVAAQSVNDAATEMQRDIAESTGAQLPIVKDDQTVTGSFISLGSTKQAEAAKISAQGIADEGYRIVTKAGNLYIIGLDTTAIDLNRRTGRPQRNSINVEMHPEIPGPAFTKNGGMSRGTANGVYSFLEDYLGVRWLMPTDLGRDVPKKSTFTIDNLNLTHAPMFIYRVMLYLGFDKPVLTWRNHMRLGYSFRLNHKHAWSDIVPKSLYKKHPEWFAMNHNGDRPAPRGKNYKLETTNPDLVKFAAKKAIKALKAHPETNTFSLSPTDGLGYSQSPASEALYDKGQSTKYGNAPSITPLILKFYSDVSNAVAKEYPQGKLAGIIYQRYIYPPSTGNAKFPKNFYPILVSKGNGYALYRPDARKKNSAILNGWGKIAPPTWFYYAHLTWRRDHSEAMVTPAAPDNFNFLYRDLVKNHIKGMFYYGGWNWSNEALANYIAAKMMWNPQADAKAIQHDWLMRAYGPKAGAVMEEFYNKMDESWYSDYFRLPDSERTRLFYQIYGKHYEQMEKLILKAEQQPMSEVQKKRLRLISNNMRLLQWRLRNADYIPADYSSPYTIDTAQVFKLMMEGSNGKGLNDRGIGLRPDGLPIAPVKVKVGTFRKSAADIPNSNFILVYPTKNGVVHLKPTHVQTGVSFLYYFVHDETGKAIKSGILDNKKDITFTAKAHTPYYLELRQGRTGSPVKWKISIPGAMPAQASFADKVLSLDATSKGKRGWVYVYVPERMNLMTESDDDDFLIQTETDERQASKARRAAFKATEGARERALKEYQGTLIQNLDRGWKFKTDPEKKGMQQGFFKADFNDKSWTKINAVGPWQARKGFEDYHGTAWYRKTFNISTADIDVPRLQEKEMLLFVGAVDGDAVFYLNGQKIAERPQFPNSWLVPFALDVGAPLIVGKNTLAVEVTKNRKAAGLYKGVSLMTGVLKKEKKK